MQDRSPLPWLLGLFAGLLTAAGWRIYSRRPRERIVSLEGIEAPEVARAYGLVSRLPPFRLLRYFVARRAAELMPQGIAADLGCGPGLLAVELAGRAPGLRVVGVDLSPEMLVQGAEHARERGVEEHASFRLGDVEQLSFPDASLDLVLSTLSLHHWSDPVTVLDEIARILRPGGAFLVVDLRRDMPAPAYLLVWFAQHVVVPAALRRIGEPLGSRNAAYTPQEAMAMLERSSLAGGRVTAGALWLAIEGQVPE
jgi:ubiquinone/menaquinone biosynthesis C-methylase UbiE